MFTGIIEKLGKVTFLERNQDSLIIAVQTGFPDLALGESIAINGVCLTVSELQSADSARFYISRETQARSNLVTLAVGSQVNLERALSLSSRLSGHLVQGHVDGLARLISTQRQGESLLIECEIDRNLARYCVEKGSITLNGVSLTLNSIRDSGGSMKFRVTLIPHTWKNTNLSNLRPGDRINVETDVLAKYVERLCQPYYKQ